MPFEMKKLILLSVFTVALVGILPAMNQDSVKLLLRQKAYERYHAVKDTVTVRTWMNMDRMNKALIQVVEYDNQILQSYKSRDTAQTNMIPVNPDTVIQQPVIKVLPPIQKSLFDMKYLLAVSLAAGVLLMILIVLLVKRTISLKRLRDEYIDRDETFDAKLNRLDFLENEVAKMKNRENEIKAELEKGIVHYQDKMQTLRKRIDELANENTRLENLNSILSEGKAPGRDIFIDKSGEILNDTDAETEGNPPRVKKVRK
jgi:hypothetical protein